jgi:hypothetical protein
MRNNDAAGRFARLWTDGRMSAFAQLVPDAAALAVDRHAVSGPDLFEEVVRLVFDDGTPLLNQTCAKTAPETRSESAFCTTMAAGPLPSLMSCMSRGILFLGPGPMSVQLGLTQYLARHRNAS